MRVETVIPVHNEEAQLAESIAKLHGHLESQSLFEHEIVIADNASTDRTLEIAQSLRRQYPRLRVSHIALKGRGRALKETWTESTADILSYMDVDLSTDLQAFPPLVEALASGGYDLATGSRLHQASRTERGWEREVISHCYNHLVKWMFRTRFSDAQCGFKAITKQAATRLLPTIQDTGWFFDTELLVIAEKCGYRVFDLPVTWIDDPDSRVKVISTAWADLRGLLRVRRNFRRGLYSQLMLRSSGMRNSTAKTT